MLKCKNFVSIVKIGNWPPIHCQVKKNWKTGTKKCKIAHLRWSEKDLFLVGHNWRGEERPLEYLNEFSSMQKMGKNYELCKKIYWNSNANVKCCVKLFNKFWIVYLFWIVLCKHKSFVFIIIFVGVNINLKIDKTWNYDKLASQKAVIILVIKKDC